MWAVSELMPGPTCCTCAGQKVRNFDDTFPSISHDPSSTLRIFLKISPRRLTFEPLEFVCVAIKAASRNFWPGLSLRRINA